MDKQTENIQGDSFLPDKALNSGVITHSQGLQGQVEETFKAGVDRSEAWFLAEIDF